MPESTPSRNTALPNDRPAPGNSDRSTDNNMLFERIQTNVLELDRQFAEKESDLKTARSHCLSATTRLDTLRASKGFLSNGSQVSSARGLVRRHEKTIQTAYADLLHLKGALRAYKDLLESANEAGISGSRTSTAEIPQGTKIEDRISTTLGGYGSDGSGGAH
jgi:hypothetical protein